MGTERETETEIETETETERLQKLVVNPDSDFLMLCIACFKITS